MNYVPTLNGFFYTMYPEMNVMHGYDNQYWSIKDVQVMAPGSVVEAQRRGDI